MKKVLIEQKKDIFEDVFKIEEAYVRYEKFNGEMTGVVRRISLERGDSVAVLILNLNTNKIIMVSQFRYPTYHNGDGWLVEIVAGMVDPGETPEETVRREVQEEIGMKIARLEHISTFYPSPGGSSERIHLFYTEVSGESAIYKGSGGLISEGEDVQADEIALEEALSRIKSGGIVDAKTIIGVYWLENRLLKKTE